MRRVQSAASKWIGFPKKLLSERLANGQGVWEGLKNSDGKNTVEKATVEEAG